MKDGEAGWTPVVSMRRKKNARSKDGDCSGNLNVWLNLIKKGRKCLVGYRESNGIPGIYAHCSLQASRWVAVKPSPSCQELELKYK